MWARKKNKTDGKRRLSPKQEGGGAFCFAGAGKGSQRGAQPGRGPVLPHPAEAEPGFPHVVRIRTDIFLRRGKCPRCRVRWGETGRSIFSKLPFSLPGRRGGRRVLRRVAAPLSAAARGVSDTLHSHRAACSLRGALRGGSAAAGSAGIGRQVGRNGGAAPPSTRARPGSTGAPPFVCIRSDAACEGACPRADAKKAASLSEAQTAPPPAFMKNLSKS